MSEFEAGDKVVHLGGRLGLASPNRGVVFTVLDGPYKITGWKGLRFIVDGDVKASGKSIRHVNSVHLMHLRAAEQLGVVKR